MLKVERLALAIAEAEGWIAATKSAIPGGSRSYRNHNPGNLRSSPHADGILDGYAVFKNDLDGFFALCWDLKQKAAGNTVTGLNSKSTIRELIYKWCPQSDGNNTEEYLQKICKMTGFADTMSLGSLLN